jgi:hypothetical protein
MGQSAGITPSPLEAVHLVLAPELAVDERKVTFKAVEKKQVLHCPLRAILAIGAEKPEFFRVLGALNDHNLMMLSVQLVGDLLIP